MAASEMPRKSIFRAKDESALSILMNTIDKTIKTKPVGTLIQNIQRHDKTSVIQPPNIGPAAEEVTMQKESMVITVA